MIGVLKSARHLHRKRRNALGILMRKPEENNHLKDFDIDGSVKLKWFLKISVEELGLKLIVSW
jgi:hypothetical protein